MRIESDSTDEGPATWWMFKKTVEYVFSLFESFFFWYAVENLITLEIFLGEKDYLGVNRTLS